MRKGQKYLIKMSKNNKGIKNPFYGKKHSEESRKKISKALIGNKYRLGKFHTIQTKQKISQIHIGNKYNLGRKLSEEHKNKLSKIWKGRKHSEKSKRKMRKNHQGMLGKKLSEETKRKISHSLKGRKFSKKWREKLKGKNHHNWKGGITPENHIIRNSLEMKLFRNAVFARDGYVCQKTGIKGGELHPHHILNFATNPELRFAIDNGITLSKEAHKEFHKMYGSKNNTKEQLEEFLKDSIILLTNKN